MTKFEVNGVAGHHAAEEPEKFALLQVSKVHDISF